MQKMIKLKAREQLTNDNIQSVLNQSPFIHYSWDAWIEMMKDNDATWCFQDRKPILEMQLFGRKQFREALDKPDYAILREKNLELAEIAKQTAETCINLGKPFDVVISYPQKRTKSIYIEVPKTVRKGLFQKKTIYEKQEMEQSEVFSEQVLFEGWTLDSFYRICSEGNAVSNISWNYCLGKDGGLYMVTYKHGFGGNINNPNIFFPEKMEYVVDDLIPFNVQLLSYKNQNIFIGAFCGLTFILDAIPIGKREEVKLNLGSSVYSYNFPLQINDFSENPYGFGEGIMERLKLLIK
ncbi:MAG: hypothetical protein IJS17_01920 [Clostridia bacterium]|nr:hypothetical protein [Clostridia bacterium]